MNKAFSYLLLALFLLPGFGETQSTLSIEEAVQRALTNSDWLRIKRAELSKAALRVRETKTAMFPTAVLEASASYLTNPQEAVILEAGALSGGTMSGLIDLTELGMGYQPFTIEMPDIPRVDVAVFDAAENTYFKIQACLKQPIFTWGKIRNAVAISTLNRDISGAELDKSRKELIREVRWGYFSVVLTEGSKKLLRKTEEVLFSILSDREKSYDEGLINLEVLLKVRADLASLRRKIVEAEESCLSAREVLNILTGESLEGINFSSYFRDYLPDMDEEELKAKAVNNSPDLNIFRKQADKAKKNLEIEKAKFPLVPDFSLVVAFDVTGQKFPGIDLDWSDTWETNVTVSIGGGMNLFDSGKALFKIKQAEEDSRIAGLGMKQYRNTLKIRIRKAVQMVRTAYYTLLECEEQLKLSREQHKNALVSYENELITREEEGGARILLYSKEMEDLLARYNLESAITELEYLTGFKF